MKNKIKALAQYIDCKKKEIEQCTYSDNMVNYFDGSEEEEEVKGEIYYIYRQN